VTGRPSRHGVIFLVGIALSTPVFAGEWCSQPEPGQLGFVFTWEGTPIQGRYRNFSLRYDFDPAKPASAQLDVQIQVPSGTTGSRDRDEGMAGVDWFDFANHPLARYRAQGAEPLSGGDFRMIGELVLKGISQEVAVDFSWNPTPAGVRMAGGASVNRLDFGVGEGDWADPELIGLTVRVEFDVELTPCAGS
jgi:polyisoprenoid-binding protein YceI